MFAISFDLDWISVQAIHPVSGHQAYKDIERVMSRFGYERIQQSVYMHRAGGLSSVTLAMNGLKALPWMSAAVKDIRAFKVEDWSDFTPFMQERAE